MTKNIHSINARTCLDENLDQMRAILEEKGVTLESAMQVLRDLEKECESQNK